MSNSLQALVDEYDGKTPAELRNLSLDKRRSRPSQVRAWQPKVWKPIYDEVVAKHALGIKNVQIAAELDLTPQQISNILQTEHAKALLALIKQKMMEKMEQDVPGMLQKVARKTATRLLTLLEDDEMFQDHPLQIVDRGLKVMEGLKLLQSGGNGATPINQQNNTFVNLPNEILERVFDGLQKSDEVARIEPPTSK